jgi:hypothetical protein
MAFISGGKAIIVNLELFDGRYDNEPIGWFIDYDCDKVWIIFPTHDIIFTKYS